MLELLTMQRAAVVSRSSAAMKASASVRVFSATTGCAPNTAEGDKTVPCTDKGFRKRILRGDPLFCDPKKPGVAPYLPLLAACFAQNPLDRPSFKQIFQQLRALDGDRYALDPTLRPRPLYRVLRCGQYVPADGLRAVVEASSITPEQHVDKASHAAKSHFLSCTKSFDWALWYWCDRTISGSRLSPPASRALLIEVQLSPEAYAQTIDMSRPNITKRFKVSDRYGASAEEVLISRHIPLEAITAVYDIASSKQGQQLLDFSQKHPRLGRAGGLSDTIVGFKEWHELMCHSTAMRSGWRDGGTFREDLRRNSSVRMETHRWMVMEEDEEEEKAPPVRASVASMAAAVLPNEATSLSASSAPARSASLAAEGHLSQVHCDPSEARAAAATSGSKRKAVDDSAAASGRVDKKPRPPGASSAAAAGSAGAKFAAASRSSRRRPRAEDEAEEATGDTPEPSGDEEPANGESTASRKHKKGRAVSDRDRDYEQID